MTELLHSFAVFHNGFYAKLSTVSTAFSTEKGLNFLSF
jgi:hypothetical protein